MGVALDAAAYQQAAAIMGELVVGLSDDEWGLVTHPDDWTVVTTVAWVVVGDSQLRNGAEGEPLVRIGDFDAAVLGPNPVAAWRGTAVGVLKALEGSSLDHQSVDHPDGTVALADLVAQRVSENLLRAWDVGQAVRRPVELPVDLADACLDFWASHADAVLGGNILADQPVEPAPGAGAVERFLGLMGRDSITP